MKKLYFLLENIRLAFFFTKLTTVCVWGGGGVSKHEHWRDFIITVILLVHDFRIKGTIKELIYHVKFFFQFLKF